MLVQLQYMKNTNDGKAHDYNQCQNYFFQMKYLKFGSNIVCFFCPWYTAHSRDSSREGDWVSISFICYKLEDNQVIRCDFYEAGTQFNIMETGCGFSLSADYSKKKTANSTEWNTAKTCSNLLVITCVIS